MRFGHLRKSILLANAVIFLAGTAIFPSACRARATAAQLAESANGASFEPLERWKAAVLAGDKARLSSFYVSDPRAFAQTPAGKSADPASEEPQFWSQFSSGGLTGMTPKILQETNPQPGMVSLVLRIEMTFQAKNETRRSLVAAAQVWVRQGESWHILVTQRGDLAPLPVLRLPEPKTPNTHLYPDPSEAGRELQSALASAKADHKRVLVVFGANWCYDCHVLDATLRSKEVAPLVAANYHVIHVSIGDGKSNSDMAQRFEVPLEKGIPSLAVLDGNGELITSQKHGEFESAAKIGMDDVTGFLNRWKPGAAK